MLYGWKAGGQTCELGDRQMNFLTTADYGVLQHPWLIGMPSETDLSPSSAQEAATQLSIH